MYERKEILEDTASLGMPDKTTKKEAVIRRMYTKAQKRFDKTESTEMSEYSHAVYKLATGVSTATDLQSFLEQHEAKLSEIEKEWLRSAIAVKELKN